MRTTLVMLIAWVCILTYKESPKGVYNGIKHDLKENQVMVPFQYSEVIKFAKIYPLGISLDMSTFNNAYVNIIIDYDQWKRLSKDNKKKLLLHESMHSMFNITHCYHDKCVMYPSLKRNKNVSYNVLLRNSIDNHLR